MKERFFMYLIRQGYKEYTPSGHRSTVFDYCGRVERVIAREGLSWASLPESISRIVRAYDVGGEHEDSGRQSHNAVINALRAFEAFTKHEA